MKMNKTNFKQYDTRWAKLGYPKSPYFIKDCGCGEVSIANCIIEMFEYADQTPKTIQPYCKQFAAPNGDGTYFSGIPKMMEHYGMTEAKEHQTMDMLWKELAKGNRVAIYLMGSRKGGSKGVHWTSGGHFVCSIAYKLENGKHMVYVKDSNSTSPLRNGWISYEENMRGDVSRVWSGKLKEPYVPTTPYEGSLPSGTVKKGNTGANVKAVQAFLNWCIKAKLAVDGDCGNNTVKAITLWQRQYSDEYGIAVDGVFGAKSIASAKKIVAKYAPTPAPAPKPTTLADKILDACKAQAEWSKNSKYKWQKDPTIAKSKNYETCVTYTACVGQRVSIIPSGKFIWHNSKGKVVGATDNFEIIYPNKKLHDLKGVLKAGDFVMDGDKTDLESGSHIFIVTGEWKDGCPIVWDNHSAQQKKMAYKYTRNRPVIAIARPKVR